MFRRPVDHGHANRLVTHRRLLGSLCLGIAGSAAVSLVVIGAPTAPNIPALNISSVPLYAATQGDKPALALALSVEFPTVGAQYVNVPGQSTDSSYTPTKEYLGYYNAEMCYTYKDNPSETPAVGKTKADYKRFVISGPASGHACSDAFSGNFLNWASNSAIDMLRLALSGGDRYIDETGLTVLQRAVLPNGDPICMWNSTNFPAKQLAKGTDGNYAGAVPLAMVNAANASGASSIWVANTLNKIYFGTSQTGSCSDTSAYRLNASVGMGPITNFAGTLPAGASQCATENGSCTTFGVQEVWYGASGKWKKAPVAGPFSCSNTIFGDPISGVGKACYLVAYTGTWAPAGGAVALNTDGFFYSRVEVCGKNASGTLQDVRDYNFCNQYPNGNYKPSGTIQKYNNHLRLAAFGYALEQTLSWDNGASTAGRYGGVLRAPMKFVGPRTYDSRGIENTPASGNRAAEWDSVTGIFKDNPDADTTFGISGVINYLNKFGRTGTTPGKYKKYDPSGELYYESLRYLQGLPPSPAAVANLNIGNAAQKLFYDGFPIYTDWTNLDPYGGNRSSSANYSCVKSNIALIGDVNTWDSRYTSGGTNNRMAATDLANNVPNIEAWISVVQAFEKGTSVSYLDGQGSSQVTSNPNSANGGPNTRGAQVYGLSYWAHTHDIRGADWTNQPAKQRPGLRVKSFFFDVNEYADQNNASTRRNNNQYFTGAKYGGFNTQPTQGLAQPFNTKGKPFYDQNGVADNNVWQNPSMPGEAQTYFLQSDARGVLAAFEKIFGDAASAQRSIAGAAASSSNLNTTSSHVYQASFDTGAWTGDVQAFSIAVDSANTSQIQLSAAPSWSADQQLVGRIFLGDTRNIVVGKVATAAGPTPHPTATDFTTSAIEQDLKDALDKYNPMAVADGLWQDRLSFLRGVKSKEGNPFRVRSHVLGDIVNSGVQYVGAPSPTRGLSDGYASFVTAQSGRAAAVYVGANDGMLHAFDATTGSELFAYIPSWLGTKLSALTDPAYGVNHQSYVDATPVIGDAKTGAGSSASDWKTVLVSGTGGGGRGVFALDVTDPTSFNASKVLWEFTQVHDADMGFVLGKPRIVKMRTSAPNAATATYRWFAMVPSGVNNYVDDGTGAFSTTGAPAIFLLALDKPAGVAWTSSGANPNYYKITLPFDSTLATTTPTYAGLATGIINLEAFVDNAGVVSYVFAGDLHGKLWNLDFTGVGASGWTAGQLSRFSTGSGTNLVAFPMYIAKDGNGNVQPITAAPTILQGYGGPTTHFVGFGTGKYIEGTDSSSTAQQTYYVLYDNGRGGGAGGASGVAGIAGRGRLQQVTSDAAGNLSPSAAFTWGRATRDADVTQRSGWFYDLGNTGERVVYDSVYVPLTTKVTFSSLIPDAATSPGVCSVSGGSGNIYYVDMVEGKGFKKASTVGVPGGPMPLFNDETTTTSKADGSGRRLRTRPILLGVPGAAGFGLGSEVNDVLPVGRLSWRQINNYLELKNR